VALVILAFWIVAMWSTLATFNVFGEWTNFPRVLPSLQNAANLGQASSLVGSFFAAITTILLLGSIYLQLRIREEQAIETHWFELLKRWSEYAEEGRLSNLAAHCQHDLTGIGTRLFPPQHSDGLSEKDGFELFVRQFQITHPLNSQRLQRLFAAIMTLRDRISVSGRDLFDNSFLPFVSDEVALILVHSAMQRGDQQLLRWLAQLGLIERAMPSEPKIRSFLTKYYRKEQQR